VIAGVRLLVGVRKEGANVNGVDGNSEQFFHCRFVNGIILSSLVCCVYDLCQVI
jgi:hypothetical protein